MNIQSKIHICLYRQKGLSSQYLGASFTERRQKVYVRNVGHIDYERNKKYFSFNLKRLLKEKGISKQFVAKKLGVHWDTVNKWSKGERIPSLEKVIQIADLLGSTVDELLKPPTPEPFPGFEDVMRLPAKERYYTVWQLAAQHAGIQVALGAMGDPLFRDQIPKLETEEEVIETYREALSYWKKVTKRLDEELRKRGIKVESEEEVTSSCFPEPTEI